MYKNVYQYLPPQKIIFVLTGYGYKRSDGLSGYYLFIYFTFTPCIEGLGTKKAKGCRVYLLRKAWTVFIFCSSR